MKYYIFAIIVFSIFFVDFSIQAQSRYPEAKSLREVINKADYIIHGRLISIDSESNLMKVQVIEVLEAPEAIASQSVITIKNMFNLPTALFTKNEYQDAYGRLRLSYQRNTIAKPEMILLLSKRQLESASDPTHFEIETTHRISAVRPLINNAAIQLTPGYKRQRIEVETGFEDMTRAELFYNIRIGKHAESLIQESDLRPEQQEEVFQIMSNELIHYDYAKDLATKLNYEQQRKIVEMETQRPGPPVYTNLNQYTRFDQPPAHQDRLGAVLTNLMDQQDPELYPALRKLMISHIPHQPMIIQAMGNTGPKALPFLEAEMNHGDFNLEAARAIAQIGSPQAFNMMLNKINRDLETRPSDYRPIIIPLFAQRWPDAWNAWLKQQEEVAAHSERVAAYLKQARAVLSQPQSQQKPEPSEPLIRF